MSQLASIHGTGVKADVRGRGRTEWPFGGPIGTVHTRKIGHFTGFLRDISEAGRSNSGVFQLRVPLLVNLSQKNTLLDAHFTF